MLFHGPPRVQAAALAEKRALCARAHFPDISIDAMEPSSDSRNNRIWFSSREPDIHEVVNPSDLLNRVNRRPKKTDRY